MRNAKRADFLEELAGDREVAEFSKGMLSPYQTSSGCREFEKSLLFWV